MKILVIDIGGTNVKVWKASESDETKIPSNKKLTPSTFVNKVRRTASDWKFDRVSIGYPGHVRHGSPIAEPVNLGSGWTDFDYAAVFGCPVRIMNDACMQALGSYEGGRMLYLGLGTSVGCAYIIDTTIVPLALGHLKLRHDKTVDECINRTALDAGPIKKWKKNVAEVASILNAAFLADYVVIGGGNAKKMDKMPEGCRRGGNHNAYFGGLRMWEDVE